MATKMRASGRVRAKGVNKAARKLEDRRRDFDRLSVIDQAARRRPGSMKSTARCP